MTSITILGGGLSACSSAFYLSRRFPNLNLTILEKQKALGGWINSKRIDNSILLERGPRTLRPNGHSVLELINLLGLEDQLVTVPKASAAAKSRYIYSNGLQRIPTSSTDFLRSPLTPVLVPSILKDTFTSSNTTNQPDESFDALLTRRFGSEFARVFGSAIVHGIYASDSRLLSVQSAFPILTELEDAGWGGITRGGLVFALKEFIQHKQPKQDNEYDLGNVRNLMKDVSVYSFKDGMQTLINALESYLEAQPNVNIIRNADVKSITKLQPGTFEITHSSHQSHYTSHIISSIPPQSLHHLLRPSPYLSLPAHLTSLTQTNPLSSVQVINLVFQCPPSHIHPNGFGYLVPRPAEDYSAWNKHNKHGVLGMVFDSCSLAAQDKGYTTQEAYYESGKYTKVSVMLGGPYGIPSSFPSAPSEDLDSASNVNAIPNELGELLKTLSMHLGKELPKPVYWKVWDNVGCIPTLMPGHQDRVKELRKVLEGDGSREGGMFKLVGAGVDGVSVPDCVKSGRNAAMAF